jgi:hypothetical protein
MIEICTTDPARRITGDILIRTQYQYLFKDINPCRKSQTLFESARFQLMVLLL